MPKLVEIRTQKHTQVTVADQPGAGGACHLYYISPTIKPSESLIGKFGHVNFQNGPIKENGVNGCLNEDLIAIVIHRLWGFQSGEFSCRENNMAIAKLEEALAFLRARTEGTNQK